MKYFNKNDTLVLVLLGLLFACISGCSDDEEAPISQSEALSTDELEVAVEDFGVVVADPVEGILTLWMDNLDASGAEYLPELKSMHTTTDTVIIRENLTISIDLTFYDAEDSESEFYDSLSTVRMTKNVTIEGSRENARRMTTLNGSNYHDIRGIAPVDTIRTIDGSGTRIVESTFEGRLREVTVTFSGEHDWIANDILISSDREMNPYPLAGNIEAIETIYRRIDLPNGSRTLELETSFDVAFDGTRYAEMYIVDFDRTYWIDLENGAVYRVRPE